MSSAFELPKNLVPADRWAEFCAWAQDGGYGESELNRWDYRSMELQRQFLEEESDGIVTQENVPTTPEQ